MNLQDKIRIHNVLIENLEAQVEIHKQITVFNSLLDLKRKQPTADKVQFWTLSELETKLNDYKDILHNYEKVYKELVSF